MIGGSHYAIRYTEALRMAVLKVRAIVSNMYKCAGSAFVVIGAKK